MPVLAYFDVIILVVAAPIMILIGVPADGYAIGAGAWIAFRALGVPLERYAAAYRTVGRAKDRQRQIDLIALLGEALDRLTHQRLIGMALKVMRKPAEIAGLGELQGFLERGYRAFGAMRGGAGEFVSIVVSRERAISEALLAGDPDALQRGSAS